MSSYPTSVVFTAGSPGDAERLGRLFTRAGWVSRCAETGAEVPDLLAREPTTLLVLSEAPERESAIDVCRRVRLDPGWNHVPALVRLAAPSTEIMAACLDGGADACLTLHDDDDALLLRLRALLRQTREPTELPPWSDGRRLRILAIDDDAIYLDLLCAELEHDTHEVLTALDGETGLRLARLAPFDCAIIDRRLPGLDGLEVCRQIAGMRDDTNWFPIAVLTALDDVVDRQVAFELGIDEFMLKSDGMTLIRARIAAVIRRRAMVTARWRIARALAESGAAAAEARAEASIARRQAEMADRLAAVNRELVVARDEAVKAARSRAEFLANMSHELRTPLHAIIGTVSLMAESLVSNGHGQELEILRASSDHLLSVINAILDFSKLDAGGAQLEYGEVDVAETLEAALLVVAPAANAKRLELITEFAPDVPSKFRGDSARLRQVLVNLIANAVKFTARGEVRVSLRAHPRPDAQVDLEIAIADTGPGIPKAVQERLFSPFMQADASTSRVFGGTGLGLAIARKLVELMGGGLGVESAPGAGATFSFRIPVAPISAEPPAIDEVARGEFDDRVIVVAYANARVRTAYLELVRSWGATAVPVASLAELERRLLHEAPAALMLDEWLHEGGAERLLGVVRGLRADLPTVVLGGSGLVGRPGVVAAQKPVRRDRLHGLVREALGAPSPRPRPPSSPQVTRAFATAHPLKILAVEDNPFNLRVLQGYLNRLGYQTDFANGGAEGVATARGKKYDLVLMDVQMPGMDGLEASRELRQTHPKGSLWICAMTASASEEERRRCIDAGMDDFVSKPVPAEVLQAALLRAWQARRAAHVAVRVLVVGPELDATVVEGLERQGHVVTRCDDLDALPRSGIDVVLVGIDAPAAPEVIARVRERLPSARVAGVTELHTDRDGLAFLARQLRVDATFERTTVGAKLEVIGLSEDLAPHGHAPGPRVARAIAAGVARLRSDLAELEATLNRLRARPDSREDLQRARTLAHAIRGLSGSVGFPAAAPAIGEVDDELQRADASGTPPDARSLDRLASIATYVRESVARTTADEPR